MRLKLTIAYDGRPFAGWQSQPGGETVQDHLQAAAAEIAGAPVSVHGSGRTDAGVHALGQVAHFDPPADNRMEPGDWQRAFNSHLPPAIRILACEAVASGFHARFSAKEKEYHYRIHTGEVLPPFLHGLAWHLPQGLDPALLEEAARIFVGTHDFRNFAANRGDEPEEEPAGGARTTRTIVSVTLHQPEPAMLELRYRGNGFLYRMVRLLTGSAVRCAQEKAALDWLRRLLHEPAASASKSPYSAPAEGLYLASVTFS